LHRQKFSPGACFPHKGLQLGSSPEKTQRDRSTSFGRKVTLRRAGLRLTERYPCPTPGQSREAVGVFLSANAVLAAVATALNVFQCLEATSANVAALSAAP